MKLGVIVCCVIAAAFFMINSAGIRVKGDAPWWIIPTIIGFRLAACCICLAIAAALSVLP